MTRDGTGHIFCYKAPYKFILEILIIYRPRTLRDPALVSLDPLQ